MTSEAIHSVVDTTNEILLLYGIHRSKQKADSDIRSAWTRIYSGARRFAVIFALGAGLDLPRRQQGLDPVHRVACR